MPASSLPEARLELPAPLAWAVGGAWRHVAIAAFLAFFLFGIRPLMDSSETRYAEGARSMIVTGDWTVPHLRGKPHMTKPPLAYWLGATGMKILGQNAWGARLPVAIATFLTILITVQLAREFGFTEAEARLAGVIQGSAIFPFISGNIFTTDVFVTLWQAFAALAAWRVWNGTGRVEAWRLTFWGVLGLAFLTKGPPALFVGIPVLLLGLFRRDYRPRHRLLSIGGVLLFLFVAASWFGYVIAKDPSRLSYYIEYEVVDRIATDVHHRDNPFIIYPPILVGGLFPWLFGWPRVFGRMMDGWRARDRRLHGFSIPGAFSILWLASSLLIFTVAKSRLPLYVLPLTIPCSIWMARYFAAGWHALTGPRPSFKRIASVIGAIYCVVLVAFRPMMFPLAPKRSEFPMAHKLSLLSEANPGLRFELSTPEESSSVPFSVDFYARLATTSDESTKNLRGLSVKETSGEIIIPVSVVKHTQIKKMRERGVTFLLLAEGTRYALVTVAEAKVHLPDARLMTPISGEQVASTPGPD